jgi:hypothetical protein
MPVATIDSQLYPRMKFQAVSTGEALVITEYEEQKRPNVGPPAKKHLPVNVSGEAAPTSRLSADSSALMQ